MAAKYVAVLSADVCAIHDWSDSVNILRRIFSVKANNVVVTRFFGTQNEALCWLTSPLHTDAVACGAAALEPASLPAPSGGHQWLALVSRSISSCVRLDAAGLGMTVGALRETTAGAFVLRRFPSADDARRWVNTPTALSLLNVVCCVPPVEDKASTSLPKDGSATVINIDLDQQGQSAGCPSAASTKNRVTPSSSLAGPVFTSTGSVAHAASITSAAARPPGKSPPLVLASPVVADHSSSSGRTTASIRALRDPSLSRRPSSTPASWRTTGPVAAAGTPGRAPFCMGAPKRSGTLGTQGARTCAGASSATPARRGAAALSNGGG